MVMGKPVVATDIAGSGVPWVNIHGETGFNVPVGQVEPLVDALRRLLDDPGLRQRMGTAARARYLREFNADLMTQRTVVVYQRLATPR
jgi:rhamnosyl/mannosyltransferase